LTPKEGGLKVNVVDKESGERLGGIQVRVGGLSRETNAEGVVQFEKVPVGRKTVEIRDVTAVYEGKYQEVEIQENQTTPLDVGIRASYDVSAEKSTALQEARQQLRMEREKLPKTAYDGYIPDYYLKIGEKLINLVSAPENNNIVRLIRAAGTKDPTAFMEQLAEVVTAVSRDLGRGMNEKRNIDVFGDIKQLVVDKGLAASSEIPSLNELLTSRDIKDGSRGVLTDALTRKFAEVDSRISKTPGNIAPLSILFRIAKTTTTMNDRGKEETRTLVAFALLIAIEKMMEDPNIEGRLRGLIT